MNATQLLKIRAEISDLVISTKEISGLIQKEEKKLEKLCGVPLAKESFDKKEEGRKTTITELKIPANFTPKTHPLYKKYEMLLRASEAAYRMEKAKIFPGITIGVDYRIRQKITGKDTGEDFISLKASVPLPLYYPLKERHAIKAKKENTKKHGAKDSTHFISISVLKNTDKSPVKDAKVSATITGPDGKAVTKKGHIMEGEGMFHYAVNVDMTAKGTYQISTNIKTGEKTETTKASFIIK